MADDLQQALSGMAATKLSVTGTRIELFGSEADNLGLGDDVELHIKGHVTMTGRELLEDKGSRRVVKIHADALELR
jgi:hypothetical protein